MTAMERIYADHRGNKMCIHTNHIREYQSQSWKSFSSLRTFQDVLFKTGAGCKDTLRRQSISKNYISTSRHQIKNQGTALFPEFINQSAANQSNDPLVPPGILTRNRLLPYRWTNFREKNQSEDASKVSDINIHDVMKLRIPKRWSRPMKKSKYPVSDEYIRNFGKRVKSNLWNKIWKARLPAVKNGKKKKQLTTGCLRVWIILHWKELRESLQEAFL